MDRVKLGRALGYGTRHAAKTVAAVVEAAAAQDPVRSPGSPPGPQVPTGGRDLHAPQARSTQPQELRQRARAVWEPLAVFSSALWLRVTGVFFALVACTLGGGAWRLRGVLQAGLPAQQHRLWVFFGFALLFAYFAISSFVRAHLRERRAARR